MSPLDIVSHVHSIYENPEELLFNISCLEKDQKFETEDWIYFIEDYIDDPSAPGGDICKIRPDGSEHSAISKKFSLSACSISSVDDHWVYYTDTDGQDRKINLLGCMDQEA